MKNITLKQFVFCDDVNKHGTSFPSINCKYWELKKGEHSYDCYQSCKLKNEKTNLKNCSLCKEREIILDIKEEIENSAAAQIRNNLPQFNFYNIKNNNSPTNQMSFGDKIKSYASAEGSQFINGKVSQEVFDKRKAHCMDCHMRKNINPEVDEIGWCGGCGCSSTNVRAGLSQKLWMPNLECPIKKFGQEQGTGFKVEDAKNSIGGIIQSVTDFIMPNKNQS